MDLTEVPVPEALVSGRVGGRPFILDRVTYHASTTTVLLHSTDRQTVYLFLFLKDGPSPAGRTFEILTPRESFDQPHVHIHYPKEDEAGNQIEAFINNYVLRLQFGAAEGGRIPGRLYVCLPDEHKSFIAGTFELPG